MAAFKTKKDVWCADMTFRHTVAVLSEIDLSFYEMYREIISLKMQMKLYTNKKCQRRYGK